MKKQLLIGFGIIFSFLFVFFFFITRKEFTDRDKSALLAGTANSGGAGILLPNQQTNQNQYTNNVPQQQYPNYPNQNQSVAGAQPDYSAGQYSYSGNLIPSGTIYFAFDKSEPLKKNANQELEKITRQSFYLAQNATINIVVEGHTDSRGTQEYNLALGQRRANWTAQKLIEKGITSDRIKVVSYGKEIPAVSGNTEEAYAKNRRTNTVTE